MTGCKAANAVVKPFIHASPFEAANAVVKPFIHASPFEWIAFCEYVMRYLNKNTKRFKVSNWDSMSPLGSVGEESLADTTVYYV